MTQVNIYAHVYTQTSKYHVYEQKCRHIQICKWAHMQIDTHEEALEPIHTFTHICTHVHSRLMERL